MLRLCLVRNIDHMLEWNADTVGVKRFLHGLGHIGAHIDKFRRRNIGPQSQLNAGGGKGVHATHVSSLARIRG